ncbi:zinc-ribbon domain-containing protein [Roseomonas gilardii]|uniref:zinc-ribbon domain-containing protein n=1 Tax=Roseomonas gilardii TaxID=257708 RepID=UPI000487A509|nr:zinc-ribbon domain-containing protein [Roseomonas gilardii]SUE62511.1 MJ0042 family finger-like domain [Roseomonas gilardii subsp. rosea]
MRIVCPGCEAAYEVPEAMLSPGRTVRCARCGRDWLPLPEQGQDATAVEEDIPAAPPVEPPVGELPTEAQAPVMPMVAEPGGPWPENGGAPAQAPPGDGSIHAAGATHPDRPASALEADAALAPEEAPPRPVPQEHDPAAAEEQERPPREEIVVPPRPAPPVTRPEHGPSLVLAWTLSILVLLAVVAALLVWREEIAVAWPPSQWLYRALGLA